MLYTIDDIHSAVLAALKASDLKKLAKTIDTYHGELQDIVDQAAQLITAMPAVWVLYAGSSFSGRTNALQDNFSVMIVYMVRDLRLDSQKAAMYPLLEAGKAALHGSNLGLNINPLRPVTIKMVKVTREFAIYSHQLSTFFA